MKIFAFKCKCPCFLYQYAQDAGIITPFPGDADFLLLTFKYEIIYDFTPGELDAHGLTGDDVVELKRLAGELDELSVIHKKQLIVFFYRDPTEALPFRNAIVFRTSAYRSSKRPFEFGMPAFVDHFPGNAAFAPRPKPDMPHVSFRGKAAALQLPRTIRLRSGFNKLMQHVHLPLRVKNWYNRGYLLRRRMVLHLLKYKKKMNIDLHIHEKGHSEPQHVNDYLNSFLQHDYFPCISNHGNYSFRLYETMREGRIPVFVDTDCVLPCEDVLDWKQLTIWIDEKDVSKMPMAILDFHQKISGADFEQLQKRIRDTWEQYFTEKGFATYLIETFLPSQLDVEAKKKDS